MVLTTEPSTLRGRVAAASAGSFARSGSTVVEAPFAQISGVHGADGDAVIAADVGVVECLVDGRFDPALLAAGIHRMHADGWQVRVLVPAGGAGEMHRILRGVPTMIQPWWVGPEDDICFGVPEVP